MRGAIVGIALAALALPALAQEPPSLALERVPFPPPRPALASQPSPPVSYQLASGTPYQAMIAAHAKTHSLPESLVHRVVKAESRYNARAVGRGGAMGLMQIKYATARGMGYTGTASGLLDPETNLTYAVRYLAGAYQAAGGNADGAVSNYRRGYYKSRRRAVRVQVASPSPLSLFGLVAAEPPRRRRVRVRRAVAR